MWQGARYKYWAWLIVAIFLLAFSRIGHAALTDIKFGRYQIADSQWNVNACLNTTTCQIYSKNPGTAYKIPWTSGQVQWAAGDYVKFELSGNASFPYLAKQYDSAGNVKATLGTGKIVNMGPDYFFFVGNDNNTGQLFSGSSGMNSTAGVSWTGTQNPTIQQADTYANATYSTVPLAAGATATQTPSSGGGAAPAPNLRPTWPVINRASNQIGFGSNRTGVWRSWWCDNYWGCGNTYDTAYINWNQSVGAGFHNYNLTYMRWPGADNGVSRTIWFRVGFDDNSELRINGQWVAGGGYCGVNCYRYGSYTAKPGEIVKLEFWSDDAGGNTYIMSVAWDPDGDGVYTLLGGSDVGIQSTAEGGGSYWYSSDITTDQTNIVTAARSRVSSVSGNQIWIEEKVGSANNTVTIEQTGSNNRVHGLGGGDAIIDGQSNNITIKQGEGTGKNLVEFGVYGAGNTVTIWQARNITTGLADGLESGGHYAGLGINGDSNTVTIKQGNEGAANSGHVGLIYVKGDSNTMTLRQAGNSDKKAFISVDGNSNTGSVYQFGQGNHYVDLALVGNGHTANVTQSGTGTQRATINLQNAGGASNLTLVQQGSTGQQYSIVQQCANLNGCSVSITQGTGP